MKILITLHVTFVKPLLILDIFILLLRFSMGFNNRKYAQAVILYVTCMLWFIRSFCIDSCAGKLQ